MTKPTLPTVTERHGLPTRLLRSPQQLRAMAHPRRLEILDLLLTEGPQTASQCATALGDSAASCSYHLRQLARYGFVEEAPGGRGRNRPWRRVPLGNLIQAADAPADQAAVEALSAVVDAHNADRIRTYLRHRGADPWQLNANLSDWTVRMTQAEVQELAGQVSALLAPLQQRTFAGQAPADARVVDVLTYLMPRPSTTSEVTEHPVAEAPLDATAEDEVGENTAGATDA